MKTEVRDNEAAVVLTKEEVEVLEKAKDLWAAIDRRAHEAHRSGGPGGTPIMRVKLEGEGMQPRLLITSLADLLGIPDLAEKKGAN